MYRNVGKESKDTFCILCLKRLILSSAARSVFMIFFCLCVYKIGFGF